MVEGAKSLLRAEVHLDDEALKNLKDFAAIHASYATYQLRRVLRNRYLQGSNAHGVSGTYHDRHFTRPRKSIASAIVQFKLLLVLIDHGANIDYLYRYLRLV